MLLITHRANVECLEGMTNDCVTQLKERFGLTSVVDYKQHIVERKALVHNEMYRLFVSCKPRVMCNDVVKEIEKFIPWWDKCARYARTCVRTASDVSGVREWEYDTSRDVYYPHLISPPLPYYYLALNC